MPLLAFGDSSTLTSRVLLSPSFVVPGVKTRDSDEAKLISGRRPRSRLVITGDVYLDYEMLDVHFQGKPTCATKPLGRSYSGQWEIFGTGICRRSLTGFNIMAWESITLGWTRLDYFEATETTHVRMVHAVVGPTETVSRMKLSKMLEYLLNRPQLLL